MRVVELAPQSSVSQSAPSVVGWKAVQPLLWDQTELGLKPVLPLTGYVT